MIYTEHTMGACLLNWDRLISNILLADAFSTAIQNGNISWNDQTRKC